MPLKFLPITPELEFDCSSYHAVSQVMMEAIESTLALNQPLFPPIPVRSPALSTAFTQKISSSWHGGVISEIPGLPVS